MVGGHGFGEDAAEAFAGFADVGVDLFGRVAFLVSPVGWFGEVERVVLGAAGQPGVGALAVMPWALWNVRA